MSANAGIMSAFWMPYVAIIVPAKISGNAMSPPPSIAIASVEWAFPFESCFSFFLRSFGDFGSAKPANRLDDVWNSAILTMCFEFQTAYMSYSEMSIKRIDADNVLSMGTNIAAMPE